ncbi:MAG: hypothetical protein QM796_10415 [Chthoniobacteraceae bacterium]
MLVHDEVRVEKDDLIARVHHGHDREQQRAADAAGDEHVADVAAVLFRQVGPQAFAERRDALRGRVAVLAVADGVDGDGLGGVGHVEVGQADREVDRVGHLCGEVEDLADAAGVDGVGAVGDEGTGGHDDPRRQDVRTTNGRATRMALPVGNLSIERGASGLLLGSGLGGGSGLAGGSLRGRGGFARGGLATRGLAGRSGSASAPSSFFTLPPTTSLRLPTFGRPKTFLESSHLP